jgi:hypothetical protein
LTALLPAWLVAQPGGQFRDLIERRYVLNVVIWLLFTAVGIVAFRNIMSARHIRANEIYGAIYVYLMIAVVFAEIFQLVLASNPAAIYFDQGVSRGADDSQE